MKKLEIFPVIKEGVGLALVNYLSIVAAVALYVLTIWIPYLNVGTTIAMNSIPAEMAKGNIINPLFIFESRFRRRMGEFFIMEAIMFVAIMIGFLFMIIPAYVLAFAWSLATILFVDKERGALEALRESNELTYGNKWRIFAIEIILSIALCIAVSIIGAVFGAIGIDWLGMLLNIVIIVFFVPCLLGAQAVIYKKLTEPEAPEAPAAPAEAPKAPKAAKKD